MMQSPDERAGVIQGLRELADELARHPDVPVSDITQISYCVIGDSDAAERAEIDQIAKALNRTAEYSTCGHYIVSRRFGPVEYRAFAIPAQAMREYEAKNSYRDSIRIEGEES
jgi:hypothetical protein